MYNFKFKKHVSIILIFTLLISFIPINTIQIFAEEENDNNTIILLDKTIENDVLEEGKDLILTFSKDLTPGKDFNLIQLYKEISKKEVEINEQETMTIEKLPLILEVGINENLLKITPDEEKFQAGVNYSLHIPKEALIDNEGNILQDDVIIDFSVKKMKITAIDEKEINEEPVVEEEKSKEELALDGANDLETLINDKSHNNCVEISEINGTPFDKYNFECVEIEDRELNIVFTKKITNVDLKKIKIYYKHEELKDLLDIDECCFFDNVLRLKIAKGKITESGNYRIGNLSSVEFEQNGSFPKNVYFKPIGFNYPEKIKIVSEPFEHTSDGKKINTTGMIILNFDQDLQSVRINPHKIKLYKISDNNQRDEVSIGYDSMGEASLGIFVDKNGLEVGANYRLEISEGAIETRFGHPVSFSYSADFTIPYINKEWPDIINTKCYKKVLENYEYVFVELKFDNEVRIKDDLIKNNRIDGVKIYDTNNEVIDYTLYDYDNLKDELIFQLDDNVKNTDEVAKIEVNTVFQDDYGTTEKNQTFPIIDYEKSVPRVIDIDPIMTTYPIDTNGITLSYNKRIKLKGEIKRENIGIRSTTGDIIPCDVTLQSDGQSIYVQPLNYLKYNETYEIYIEEGMVEDEQGTLSKAYTYQFDSDKYQGPIIESNDFQTNTEYRNNRTIDITTSFEENIEANHERDIVRNSISIYRIKQEGSKKTLTALPVNQVNIEGNQLKVKTNDYFTENAEYKVLIRPNIIKDASHGVNTKPIIYNIDVRDTDRPFIVNKDEVEKNIRNSIFMNKEIEFVFNEDVRLKNDYSSKANLDGRWYRLRTVGNIVKTEPLNYRSLYEDKDYELVIPKDTLQDKNGNTNEEISIKFNSLSQPKYELKSGKGLKYINGMIVLEFDEEIESVGDAEELNGRFNGGTLPIENVFYYKNLLLIQPKLMIQPTDFFGFLGYRQKLIYNPNAEDYDYLKEHRNDKNIRMDTSAKDSLNDNINFHKKNNNAINYYLKTHRVNIPEGFIKFKSGVNPYNKKIFLSDISYNFNKTVAEFSYKKKERKWYGKKKWVKKKKDVEIITLAYHDIDMKGITGGLINKSSIIQKNPVEFSSSNVLVWDLEENKSKQGKKVDYAFLENGDKKVTGVLLAGANTAYDDITLHVTPLPNINNTILNIDGNKSTLVEFQETIPINLRLSCDNIPFEDKKITVYENIDGKKVEIDTIETNANGCATYTYPKSKVDEIKVGKDKGGKDKAELVFETEGLLAEINGGKPIVKEIKHTLIRGNVKCKIIGDIVIELNNTDITDDVIKKSLDFYVGEEKKQATYNEIKRATNKIIVNYEIQNLNLAKQKTLTVYSKLFQKIEEQKTMAKTNDLHAGWSKKDFNVELLTEKVTQNINLKDMKTIENFSIKEAYIQNRGKKEDKKPYIYIKNISVVDTLMVDVEWGKSKEGFVVLKKADEAFNMVINSNGQLDIEGYEEKRDKETLIKLEYSKQEKKYVLKTDFNLLSEGEYNITAVNSNGLAVTAKNNIKVIPRMPKLLDMASYYVTGTYFVGMSINKGVDIKLPKIPGNIPLVGGDELGLNFGELFEEDEDEQTTQSQGQGQTQPSQSKVEEAKKIINSSPLVAIFDNEEMEFRIGLEFSKELKSKSSKEIESLMQTDRRGRVKTNQNGEIKRYDKKKKLGKFEVGFDYGFDVKVTYDDELNKWIYWGGAQVGVNAGVSWTYYYIVPITIVPVPTYVTAGVEAGVTLGLGVIVEDKDNVYFAYTGEFEINAELAAGIGIDAIKGEFFGEVGLNAEIEGDFRDIKNPSGEIGVTAETGVRLVVDLWAWSKTIKKSFDYEWKKEFGDSNKTAYLNEKTLFDPYEVLQSPGKTLARRSDEKRNFHLSNVFTHNKLSSVQQADTISQYTDQKIVKLGRNELLIAVLDDNLSRSSEDRNEIQYKVFNNSGSTPFESIDNDQTLDSSFDMSSYKDSAAIVWTNYNKKLSEITQSLNKDIETTKVEDQVVVEEGEIRNYIQYADINVAIYDKDLNTWDKQIITDDMSRDYNPKIATEDDKMLAVWSKNTGNELIQNKINKDSLYYCNYVDKKWTSPQKVNLNSIDGLILDYSPAIINGEEYITFTVDTDSDLCTNNDNEIYFIKKDEDNFDNPIPITSNSHKDSNPKLTKVDDQPMLTYINQNQIYYVNNIDKMEQPKLAIKDYDSGEDYDVVYNKKTKETFITWSKIKPEFVEVKNEKGEKVKKIDRNIMEVYSSLYDARLDNWSNSMQITQDKKFNRFVDTTIYNDKLKLVYSSVYIDFAALLKHNRAQACNMLDRNFMTATNANTVSTKLTLEEATNSSLVIGEFDRQRNITLRDIKLSKENPMPGEEILVEAVVENTGEYVETVDKINISFDNEGNGIGSGKLEKSLMPGEQEKVLIKATIPEYSSKGSIIVKVDSVDMVDLDDSNKIIKEIDEDDNKLSKICVFETMKILSTRTEYKETEDKYVIYSVVKNTSNIPIKNVNMELHRYNSSDVLEKISDYNYKSAKALETNETIEITYEISGDKVKKDKDKFKLVFYPNSKDAYENYDYEFYLYKKSLDMDNYSFVWDNDQLKCYMEFNNQIKPDIGKEDIKFLDNVNKPLNVEVEMDKNIIGVTIIDSNNIKDNTNYTLKIPENSLISMNNNQYNKAISIPYYKHEIKKVTDNNYYYDWDTDEKEKNDKNNKDKESKEPKIPRFKDIEDNWAKDYISELVEAKIINGYADGTFKPNNPITRAEFVTLVVKMLKINLCSENIFKDTENSWANDYITTAYKKGFITGYSKYCFRPNEYITREQMAVIIIKALKLKTSSVDTDFIDNDSISDWAVAYINAAAENKLINGYSDNHFYPKKMATRAETVKIIYDCYKKISK